MSQSKDQLWLKVQKGSGRSYTYSLVIIHSLYQWGKITPEDKVSSLKVVERSRALGFDCELELVILNYKVPFEARTTGFGE